ncbi:putative serine/threonine-protein kinase-like protein CCR3 [Miscanthus floridulus]|uniref:putative serine/threonine-protein kinase-like protein CCR3 n=1 Tax=Miscanthus floridulus TaxID=154761 RepID=UPI003457C923
MSHLRHKHLINLVGYYAKNDECLLVSEYMRNGTLYDHLHLRAAPSSPPSLVMLSWKLRIRILLDMSCSVEYMHMLSFDVLPIIHGDVKSSNILLDASWRARLSGFGLSSLTEWQAWTQEHWTIAGVVGYMDPEYYSLHHLTMKSDVYSFGMVMLEVLTGKRAILEEFEGALRQICTSLPASSLLNL